MKNSIRRLLASVSKRHQKFSFEQLEDRRMLSLWTAVDLSDLSDSIDPTTRIETYELFQLDTTDLLMEVENVPFEFSGVKSQTVISIPRPDNSFERFNIYSSGLMSDRLAAQFPEIRTFTGQGVDDPTATIQLSVSPLGLHVQVLSAQDAYYIDPYATARDSLYVSYFKQENTANSQFVPYPPVDASSNASRSSDQDGASGEANYAGRNGTELREYRLAVATTGEYSQYHASLNPGVPTQLAALSAVVAAVNRVDGVYRRELSITFRLVDNNGSIIFTDPATDPYTNDFGFLMLGENQSTLNSIIGNANFEIGHVFSTGGGGVAALASVGIDSIKAQGVTGLPEPIGDAFYIDYVSHEMGHQFGANHTFNGIFCGRTNQPTAFEPGSGTTIMGYAGICGPDDVQSFSDPYFHSISFEEILAHVDVTIPSIGRRIPTSNAVPNVDAGQDYVIPARTPFVLTAAGSDANEGDELTYSWEQRDSGPAQRITAPDNGRSPLFRFVPPTTQSTRYFPGLASLVNNTLPIGEQLPTTTRSLNFRSVVRDNRFSGGGVNTDDMSISVIDTGEAFEVTSPNTAVVWQGLSQQTVSWSTAGTNSSPINQSQVDILFSSDGGLTYPIVLDSQVANTGQAVIFAPNLNTTRARVMVRGSGNIFFDISNVDFTINAVPLIVNVAPQVSTYEENSSPTLIASQSVVLEAQTLAGLSIDVRVVVGRQSGDLVSLISGQGIGLNGQSITLNGVSFATLKQDVSGSLLIRLNANATLAMFAAVLRRIGFSNSTDNPLAINRTVEFLFANGLRQSVQVIVQPMNDPPAINAVLLPEIPEDSTVVLGAQIGQLWNSEFSDPDEGAFLSGIAVVHNPQLADQGIWHYSTGITWLPIGNVDDSQFRLLLARGSRLGFLPARNYFGLPDPLIVRGLDDAYVGNFSSIELGQRVFFQATSNSTTISNSTTTVGVEVINVNDPPFATTQVVNLTVIQDQAIDRQLNSSLFEDVDSALTWNVTSQSEFSLPAWLSFDSSSRSLLGTPRNRDVGTYQLTISATDGEFTAQIPLIVRVTNLNDPPEQLRFESLSIPENSSAIQIGRLFAIDPDRDEITWTSSDSRIALQGDQVILVDAIDYETEQRIPVTFRATDNGVPSEFADIQVVLNVVDINEFFPDLRSQDFEVLHGTPGDFLLTRLSAPDGDSLQTVRFIIRSGDVGAFSLDEKSGELRFLPNADLKQKSEYKVFLEAFDNGTPRNSKLAQLNVKILPVNNHPPVVPPGQRLSFSENLPAGSVVGIIQASDADDNPLGFELLEVIGGATNWLSIHPSSGVVSVTGTHSFDFESGIQHALRIRVVEEIAPQRSVEVVVPLELSNVNDRPHGIEPVRILSSRQGVSAQAFVVLDQDLSSAGYSFATSDPRYEIRDGKLALRPNRHFDASLAGTNTTAVVRVSDNSDPTSAADIRVTVQIVLSQPWQNPIDHLDVNRDGRVTSLDALQIINVLNSEPLLQLNSPRLFEQMSMPDYDTSGDSRLSAFDALLVINRLNIGPLGEGESDESLQSRVRSFTSPETWMMAYQQIEELDRRRRR